MPKSIRTTSNTNTPKFISAANQTTFDIGDVVLCPSLSSFPFALTNDPTGKRDGLMIIHDGSHFYYDSNGCFIRANNHETDDYQPSLYHNTPANQQAINTLYSKTSTTQSSQRQIIDTTSADDEEVVLIKSFTISNNTCEVYGAAESLDDISLLLGLICSGKVCQESIKSLARLTQTTVDAWAEILHSQVERTKEVLTLTKFGKVGE